MDWKKVSGSKRFRLVAAAAGGLATLGAAAAAVAASLAPATTVINACVDRASGAVRIIDPNQQVCTKKENAVSWNQQGPEGPAGATGPAGEDGRDGRDGVTGATGPAGPQGAQGVQGPQGVQGQTGPAGPAGPAGGGVAADPDAGCDGGVGFAQGQGYELFLKLDDIKGEVLDSRHKDEIETLTFSWGGVVSTASGSSGSAAGVSRSCPFRVSMNPLTPATAEIVGVAARGQHLHEATLTIRKAGGDRFVVAVYKLSDILITNGGASFEFEAQKIDLTYNRQAADGSLGGSVRTTWDFAANKQF